MANSVISLGIQVDGENTFKTALSAIDAQIKSLGAGVEAATASMGKMGDSEEAAAQKTNLLGQQLAAQQQKMQVLSEMYGAAQKRLAELAAALERARASGDPAAVEKATNAYNKQSTVVSNLAGKMAKTESEMAKTRDAMEGTGTAAEKTGAAMQKTGTESDKLAESVSRMAGIMTAQFAGQAVAAVWEGLQKIGEAAAQAVTKIYDITTAAGQYADTMLTMASTTGVDVIDLQKWEYASQFIDTSVETITGSMKKLETNLISGSEGAAKALETLGVSARDSAGNWKSTEDVMFAAVDALQKVQDPIERDALAMSLFGKSAAELNPLIEAGSAAFKGLGDEAQSMGLILSGDTLTALGAVDDATNKMNSAITAAGQQIGAAFAPAVTTLTDGATQVVTAFIGMVTGVEGSSAQFSAAIDSLISNALQLLNDMLPKILEVGVQVIVALIDGIMKRMDDISKTISNVITLLITTIVKLLPDILKAGVEILIAVIDGIIQALPELIANVPRIIEAIVNGLASLAPKLLEAGVNIIRGLWEGIASAIDWLWQQIKDALGSVFGWLLDLLGIHSPSTVMRDQVGRMLGLGMAEGIMDSAGAVQRAYGSLLPDSGRLAASVDGYSVAASVAGAGGGSVANPWRDDRPIILQLNDRELGRAVRGYAQ